MIASNRNELTVDGNIYRMIVQPGGLLKNGEWEILYNGGWLKVRNYEIRKKLTELWKTEKR